MKKLLIVFSMLAAIGFTSCGGGEEKSCDKECKDKKECCSKDSKECKKSCEGKDKEECKKECEAKGKSCHTDSAAVTGDASNATESDSTETVAADSTSEEVEEVEVEESH